jgi:hypothetical protein
MKLNGWTRLCIVLSLIWLTFVGFQAYNDISGLIEKKEWEVAKDGVGRAVFVFSKSEPEEFIRRYISEELIPMVSKNPNLYVGKTTTTPYDATVKKELFPMVIKYIEEAFLPLVGAFLSVLAVLWIRRGFARSNAS